MAEHIAQARRREGLAQARYLLWSRLMFDQLRIIATICLKRLWRKITLFQFFAVISSVTKSFLFLLMTKNYFHFIISLPNRALFNYQRTPPTCSIFILNTQISLSLPCSFAALSIALTVTESIFGESGLSVASTISITANASSAK